ncbi:MAG: hypothetical protein PHY09_14585 [Desulfuromonadaceae bacterium]|nr:hypothetical protein [Desulfuromonadaceae bacterium]MDD5107032.1 hypothetical protein [Desulfuromonadaceae bacterium]
MKAPLTAQEVKQLAENWYRKLDVHAPMVEVLPMLSEEGLKMIFPEATLTTMAEFEGWYQRVIRIFFDEVHTVKEVTSEITGDTARVNVVVEWQASVWNPPAAVSARIILDAYQSWTVQRSQATGKAVISSYSVDELRYHEGSAQL